MIPLYTVHAAIAGLILWASAQLPDHDTCGRRLERLDREHAATKALHDFAGGWHLQCELTAARQRLAFWSDAERFTAPDAAGNRVYYLRRLLWP